MRRQPLPHSEQAGFTIIEVVVVMVLFALLVPTIALSIDTLRRVNKNSQYLILVTNTAEAKTESLRAKPFDQIPLGNTDFSSELPSQLPTPRTATYTVAASPSSAQLKVIDLTITYTISGTQTRYSYKTYVGSGG